MYTAANLSAVSSIRHGFFTRNGGVSEGIYASLNCGPGSGDNPNHVIENRNHVAMEMGAAPGALNSLYQVHGSKIMTLTNPLGETRPEADGMVTAVAGLPLGILTADCGPLLFVDPQARVIGAAHAGWKGAMGGVIAETVKAMEALGANRTHIRAALGPCIGQLSYEVGDEFVETFLKECADNKRFFAYQLSATQHNHRPFFNLKAYIQHKLALSGVRDINILANDTCVEEDDFFSYRRKTRRNEPDYGRQISAIMLKAS